MKFAHVGVVALLLFVGTPWRSAADPITIQSGSLTATAAYDSLYISLVGAERGFTFDSWLSILDARFDPFGAVKPAGTTVGVGGQWSTTGFFDATATLDGRTFPEPERHISGMQLRDPQAFFLLDGPRAGPLPLDGDLFTVYAPFTFSGFFNYLEDPSLPNSALVWNRNALIGQGTASLTYAGTLGGSGSVSWRFRSASYQFEPPPVPEPWTVLLFGSGLVGLVARIRGRRKGSTIGPR